MKTLHNDPLKILIVDDQDSVRRYLHQELRNMGALEVIAAATAEDAVAQFKQHKPDLILLDIEMPGRNGYWIAEQIRNAEGGNWTPIIFLTALDRDEDLWEGIRVGGDDYLIKPVRPTVLAAKIRAMQRLLGMQRRLTAVTEELFQANNMLNLLVERDGLTGLINRRGFDRLLHEQIAYAHREVLPLTLMICDIDYFKQYNDTLGHPEGDKCLQKVAALLGGVCRRPTDSACRIGGEEFALILPNTPRSGAMVFARTLAELLASQRIVHPKSPIGEHLTLSAGITTCIPDAATTMLGMVTRADEALYAAKARGRNDFFSYELQVTAREQLAPRKPAAPAEGTRS
ncbi:diguanylate cyclase [Xylophilus rhododendri]|uniref:diguanylate cyclase n=1 Tax=Xylophilus rhododendri TaxID=2697032 RepID=A0A857J1A3_9BURK|nr:diguanylate cyclase [Xylophilus rhododendri]QHI97684.1 diguanylate cyclase [Xylophilus rhododendri]